ncbi:hypothetical protein ACJZ2D_004046 [Fusarium nematophilum]
MPGTLSSLGCEACRKQKKGCVGNGVKRWQFKSFQAKGYQLRTPAPRRLPSNGTTKVASSLVHILGIDDIRYDIRAFGGRLVPDLPPQIGSSPALDSCVSALVALYRARQYRCSNIDALTRYGQALTATRKAMEDPTQPIGTKMQSVSIIFICQVWIDRKHAEKHREMIAHLFREAVVTGKLDEINPSYVYGLCQVAVLASFLNPRFTIDQWFWDACKTCASPRPVRYHQGSFLSLEAATLAEASLYVRRPRRHLYQIKRIYDIIQSDRPRVRHFVTLSTLAARSPGATSMTRKVCTSYRFAHGTLLGLGSILNHILRIFSSDPSLVEESHEYVDESIVLANECADVRPFGAAFVDDYLKMVLASISDSYRVDEVEAILVDYQKDVEGAEYLEEAMETRRRLQRLAKGEARARTKETDKKEEVKEDDIYDRNEISECVIL